MCIYTYIVFTYIYTNMRYHNVYIIYVGNIPHFLYGGITDNFYLLYYLLSIFCIAGIIIFIIRKT